jgi:hypothetical protein
MTLAKLQFRPGIVKDLTAYTNEGGWIDGDHVRFRLGFPEKIGGWVRVGTERFIGACRALHAWGGLAGQKFLGVGTHLKYYIMNGDLYYDVTPVRATTAAGDVTFDAFSTTLTVAAGPADTILQVASTTGWPPFGRVKINNEIVFFRGAFGNELRDCVRGTCGTAAAAHAVGDAVNCSHIVVTDTGHGAIRNDFVTFDGATALGGEVTAGVLNQEHCIVHVINANSYVVVARNAQTRLTPEMSDPDLIDLPADDTDIQVFATSADSGNGGTAAEAEYQLSGGQNIVNLGGGWGAGTWGELAWDGFYSQTVENDSFRIWGHDNFGEWILACPRGGPLFYWNPSIGLTNRMARLDALPGANETPELALQVMVSEQARHVIAFGTTAEGSSTLDPLLIRFSAAEDPAEWESTATTTAGELRLSTGSTIVRAIKTRQHILVFTDASLYAMHYLGAPFIFGVTELAYGISIMGPNAAGTAAETVFWMGQEEFYVYAGQVRVLPCTVRDYVFNDLNRDQREKITCGTNIGFSEVWWFYPSRDSLENDRYVVFNYEQQTWVVGTLERTAWLDRGARPYPVAAGTNRLYDHELGHDADGQALEAHIESGPVDMDDGHNFVFASRLLPDLTFRNSSTPTPEVLMTVKTYDFPGQDVLQSNGQEVAASDHSTHLIERHTSRLDFRLRGRSFSLRVESNLLGVAWRLGSPRIDIRPDGRR